MPSARPLVIFDLDGTLIDTGPDLLDSLNHVIASEGLEPLDMADLRHLVGQGARAMIARAFRLREVALADDTANRLFAMFLDHYADGMPGRSRPFDGLEDAMRELRKAGFSFAVCTNKSEALAKKLLQSLQLTDHFEAITGGDSFSFKKPDGRHILETVNAAGASRDASIMIGDSVNDIAAARSADIPAIAVTFGYSDVPVADLSPDATIDNFAELPAAVTALTARSAVG